MLILYKEHLLVIEIIIFLFSPSLDIPSSKHLLYLHEEQVCLREDFNEHFPLNLQRIGRRLLKQRTKNALQASHVFTP